MNSDDPKIEAVARLCHEMNRAWCALNGDATQVAWEDAPAWQRQSAINGVLTQIEEKLSPRQQHEAWMRDKLRNGWVYGPDKDAEARTHPCIVEYEALPAVQRTKDHIFVAVVRAHFPEFFEP